GPREARSTSGVGQALPRVFLPRQRRVRARGRGHERTIRIPPPSRPGLSGLASRSLVAVLVAVEERNPSIRNEMCRNAFGDRGSDSRGETSLRPTIRLFVAAPGSPS